MRKLNVLSLFGGVECSYPAFQELGFEIDNYYTAEVDPYAISITRHNIPNAIHLGDVTKIDFTEFKGKIDIVIGGSPCFVKDTLVHTSEGMKPIQDIKEGDLVYTHTNFLQKVLKPIKKKANSVYSINVGSSETIETTEEHPFYAREKTEVKKLSTKGLVRAFKDPEWVKVRDLSENHYLGTFINKESVIPEHETLGQFFNDPDFWWVIGRYFADGWTTKVKRKFRNNSFLYKVLWCSGKNDPTSIELKDKLGKFFNVTVTQERTVIKYCVSSMVLLEWLDQFGKYAHGKKINGTILNLPIHLLKEFNDGYFSGDGHVDSTGLTIASTVSRELAYGLGACVAKGYKVPYYITKIKNYRKTYSIEGRTGECRQPYVVSFRLDSSHSLSFIEDGFMWSPINSITCVNEEVEVFNLEVENDNSYNVYNTVVHNCTFWSIAKKERETTSEGIGYELFMHYSRAVKETEAPMFVYENNHSIHQDIKDAITKELGVEHIMLNSALVSAQSRRRCYWTNIPVVGEPKDMELSLLDIIENDVLEKYYVNSEALKTYIKNGKPKGFKTLDDKAHTVTASVHKGYGNDGCTTIRVGHFNKGAQADRVYSMEGKTVNLVANGGGRGAKTGLYEEGDQIRRLTPLECERAQTLPDNWTKYGIDDKGKLKEISDTQRYKCVGNGWTKDIFKFIYSFIK